MAIALHRRLAPFLREDGGLCSIRREGVQVLVGQDGLSEKEAILTLLDADIWPERFRRNHNIFSVLQMQRLLRSRVLLVGCGGLGGQTALLLARSGVGALRVCDPDIFEESNLNRQMLCTERVLGRPKAEVCRDVLREIASYIEVEGFILSASPENLPALFADADVVVDCLDSISKKIMLERQAKKAGIPYIHGAVAHEEGFAFDGAVGWERLSQMYPEPVDMDEEGSSPTSACAAAGTAVLLATLVIRRLLNPQTDASPLYHFDASVPELETFLSKTP